VASHLHHSRTICRRAERAVVALVREGAAPAVIGVYINRLSDYLFVAARYAAMKTNATERVYKKSVGLTERVL
jgi:cob(I)alamin adenosyltransferase